MTIDEAIAQAREVVENNRKAAEECLMFNQFQKADECVMCAEEHEQLAEWLEELKDLREMKEAIESNTEVNIRSEIELLKADEKSPAITEEALEKTILSLVNSFESESKANNVALISNLFDKFDKNEDLYECEMHLAFMNFGSFAAMPWLSKHPEVTNGRDKFCIQHIYTGLLSHFLRRIIEKNEGSPFSGDKESFIISMLKKSIATGENISLYRTYEGVERIPKEKWGERAYWSPTSFKDTDDVKEKFKMWYQLTQ